MAERHKKVKSSVEVEKRPICREVKLRMENKIICHHANRPIPKIKVLLEQITSQAL